MKKFIIVKTESEDINPKITIINAPTISSMIMKYVEIDEEVYYAFGIVRKEDEEEWEGYEDVLFEKNLPNFLKDDESLLLQLSARIAEDGPYYTIHILNEDDTTTNIFNLFDNN